MEFQGSCQASTPTHCTLPAAPALLFLLDTPYLPSQCIYSLGQCQVHESRGFALLTTELLAATTGFDYAVGQDWLKERVDKREENCNIENFQVEVVGGMRRG